MGDDSKTILLSLAPGVKNVDQLNFYGAGSFRSIRQQDPDRGGTVGNDTGEIFEAAGYFLPEVS